MPSSLLLVARTTTQSTLYALPEFPMKNSFIILLIIATSCSPKKADKETAQSDSIQTKTDSTLTNVDYFSLQTYLETAIIDTAQIQKIDFNCALMIAPTTEQIEEMQKEEGEDFATIADDGSYYQATSNMLLDSMKIKVVDASQPYVQFIGENKIWTLNIRKNGLPVWNLIFFHRKKDPIVVGMAGLTAEQITKYF